MFLLPSLALSSLLINFDLLYGLRRTLLYSTVSLTLRGVCVTRFRSTVTTVYDG